MATVSCGWIFSNRLSNCNSRTARTSVLRTAWGNRTATFQIGSPSWMLLELFATCRAYSRHFRNCRWRQAVAHCGRRGPRAIPSRVRTKGTDRPSEIRHDRKAQVVSLPPYPGRQFFARTRKSSARNGPALVPTPLSGLPANGNPFGAFNSGKGKIRFSSLIQSWL